MSERLTRKEIKQKDHFETTVGATLRYGRSHGKQIGMAIAVVVAVVIAALAVVLVLRSRGEKAAAALAEAREAFAGTVLEDGATPDPEDDGPTFASDEERRARAEELFNAVVESYGGTDSADIANAYLARLAAERGDLERARALWEGFLENQSENALAMEVRLNLISLKRSQGEAEVVAQDLEAMLAAERRPLPEDTILYELGRTMESLDRDEAALGYYQRIVDEFPRSLYGVPAQQKTAALKDSSTAAS